MKLSILTPKHNYFLQNANYVSLFKKRPYGSATQIRKLLVEKFGETHNFSLNYINMVLNPDDKRMNLDILETAVLYFKEVMIQNARMDNLLNDLDNLLNDPDNNDSK